MHMTNKLKYLTKLSLDKKIKTKWFLIANIILLVIIAGIIINVATNNSGTLLGS